MRRNCFLFFVFIFLFTEKLYAAVNSIQAIVGSEAITSFDVASKLRFVAIINRIDPDKASKDAQFNKDILRGLIDEILITKFAKKLKIELSAEEIAMGTNALLGRIGISEVEFKKKLSDNAIERKTMLNFIKSELFFARISSEYSEKFRSASDDKVLSAQIIQKKIEALSGIYEIGDCKNSKQILHANEINQVLFAKILDKKTNSGTVDMNGSALCFKKVGADKVNINIENIYKKESANNFMNSFFQDLYNSTYIKFNL